MPMNFSSVQQEPILAVALHVPLKVLQHNTPGFLRKLCSALLALELAVCHCRSILEQRVEHLQGLAVFSWQKYCLSCLAHSSLRDNKPFHRDLMKM